MPSPAVVPGSVYVWSFDDRLVRILEAKAEVVMYDAGGRTFRVGDWRIFETPAGAASITTITSTPTLLGKATHLRDEPLSDEERDLHRPDLPFAVGQCADLEWPRNPPGTPEVLGQQLGDAGCLARTPSRRSRRQRSLCRRSGRPVVRNAPWGSLLPTTPRSVPRNYLDGRYRAGSVLEAELVSEGRRHQPDGDASGRALVLPLGVPEPPGRRCGTRCRLTALRTKGASSHL